MQERRRKKTIVNEQDYVLVSIIVTNHKPPIERPHRTRNGDNYMEQYSIFEKVVYCLFANY
jgi:hypothetical protein